MSASRWAVSAFLVWYLAALVIAAIPEPSRLSLLPPSPSPAPNALAASLGPWFDDAAAGVSSGASRLSRVVAPIRPVTEALVVQAGMAQRWDMFAAPPRRADYLRITWYVSPVGQTAAAKPVWKATRLVLPQQREDRIRGPLSARDLAMNLVFAGPLERAHPSGDPSDLGSRDRFAAAVGPAIRYATRRFEHERLGTTERITRIEAWHGMADLPLPGAPRDDRHALRLDALNNYYQGAIEEPMIGMSYPPYLAVQTESDIVWTLEYIYEPR